VVTVSRVLLFTAVGLMGACGTIPAAPTVMALPGHGKTLEQFHAEDTSCRQWAAQQTQETVKGASTGQLYGSTVEQWYNMAYMQCMYANGNQIPGVRTGSFPPPPPPPSTPAPPGSPPPEGAEPTPPAQAP